MPVIACHTCWLCGEQTETIGDYYDHADTHAGREWARLFEPEAVEVAPNSFYCASHGAEPSA